MDDQIKGAGSFIPTGSGRSEQRANVERPVDEVYKLSQEISDLYQRINALTKYLKVEINRNYEPYHVVNYNKLMEEATRKSIHPNPKKWYQFWK